LTKIFDQQLHFLIFNPSITKSIIIITTHPIQYNAPLFQYLAKSGSISIKVFYTWGENSVNVYDPGFTIHRSWDIDLLTGYDHVFIKNTANDSGSHHYRGIINPDLIQQVASYHPDAIIVYGWKFQSHLKLMRHFKGKIPIFFRGDSTLLDEPTGFNLKKFGRKVLLNWVYKNVDFALSPGMASDDYYRWVGLKSEQIIRVPHAVDNNRFNGEDEEGNDELEKRAAEWKKELGITEDKKVFLFAGKFEPKKDPLILINAFKKLLQKIPDIHLIMVGDGLLKSEIEKDSQVSHDQPTNLRQSSITILPFQNQSLMPIVFRLANIYVLPSKGPGETWGLAINEAMASGKPVLVSDKCGAANDLVDVGRNGHIFKAGDELDLIQKMECMLQSDILAMGRNAQQKSRDFGYKPFLMALEKLLD
jgi:glycosyltransferase involved in cell wall biosynthesis